MRECVGKDGVSVLVVAPSMRCRLGCAEGIVAAAVRTDDMLWWALSLCR